MASEKGFAKRLAKRRNKGDSPAPAAQSNEAQPWEVSMHVKPGYYAKFTPFWNSGYDGSGKGTW